MAENRVVNYRRSVTTVGASRGKSALRALVKGADFAAFNQAIAYSYCYGMAAADRVRHPSRTATTGRRGGLCWHHHGR